MPGVGHSHFGLCGLVAYAAGGTIQSVSLVALAFYGEIRIGFVGRTLLALNCAIEVGDRFGLPGAAGDALGLINEDIPFSLALSNLLTCFGRHHAEDDV